MKASYQKHPNGYEEIHGTWVIQKVSKYPGDIVSPTVQKEGYKLQISFSLSQPKKNFIVCIKMIDLDKNIDVQEAAIWLHAKPEFQKKVKKNQSILLLSTLPKITMQFAVITEDLLKNGLIFDDDSMKISFRVIFKEAEARKRRAQPLAQDEKKESGPDYTKRSVSGFIGLKSSGTTCYMNSVLQALFHLTKLREDIFSIPENISDAVILSSQRLFYNMMTKPKSCSTTYLTQAFGWGKEELLKQKDAQEFLHVFITALEEKIKKTDISGEFFDLFQGMITRKIICKDANLKKMINEPFYELHLEVTDCESVYDSLKRMKSEQVMANYDTEMKEFGKREAITSELISKTPPILAIQLLRFTYNKATEKQEKINSRYTFPVELDIDDYVTEDLKGKDNKYVIFAVLVHSGYVDSGHYYTYVRSPGQYDWLCFDDMRAFRSNEQEAIDKNFGGYMRSAYMILYAKKSMLSELFFPLTVEDIPKRVVEYSKNKAAEEKEEKRKEKCIPCILINEEDIRKTVAATGNGIIGESSATIQIDKRDPASMLYEESGKMFNLNPQNITILRCDESGYPISVVRPEINSLISLPFCPKMIVINDKLVLSQNPLFVILEFFFPKEPNPIQYIGIGVIEGEEKLSKLLETVREKVGLNPNVELDLYVKTKTSSVLKKDLEITYNELSRVVQGEFTLIFSPKQKEFEYKFECIKGEPFVLEKEENNIKDMFDIPDVDTPQTYIDRRYNIKVYGIYDMNNKLICKIRMSCKESVLQLKHAIAKAANIPYDPAKQGIILYHMGGIMPISASKNATIEGVNAKDQPNAFRFKLTTLTEEELQTSECVTTYVFVNSKNTRTCKIPLIKSTTAGFVLNELKKDGVFKTITEDEEEEFHVYTVLYNHILKELSLEEPALQKDTFLKVDQIIKRKHEEGIKRVKVNQIKEYRYKNASISYVAVPFFFEARKGEVFKEMRNRLCSFIQCTESDKKYIRFVLETHDVTGENKVKSKVLGENSLLYDEIEQASELDIIITVMQSQSKVITSKSTSRDIFIH